MEPILYIMFEILVWQVAAKVMATMLRFKCILNVYDKHTCLLHNDYAESSELH